jgi:hypothetical protein
MAKLLAPAIAFMRNELKKLEAREAELKIELADAQESANGIRKILKGANKNGGSQQVN